MNVVGLDDLDPGRFVMNPNVRRFARFSRTAGAITGLSLLALAAGCWNKPLDIYRDIRVHGNVEIVSDEISEGNLDVERTVTAEDVEAHDDVTAGDDVGAVDDVMVGDDVVAIDDVIAGDDLEHVGDIVQIPTLPPPDPDDEDNDDDGNGGEDTDGGGNETRPLTVMLLAPFVGLLEEGISPTDCVELTLGKFNVEARLTIDGKAPFTVQFRNYYGSIRRGVIDTGEVSFFFDASVPTTTCVSSQIRVTDAEGNEKNLFFYLSVR